MFPFWVKFSKGFGKSILLRFIFRKKNTGTGYPGTITNLK